MTYSEIRKRHSNDIEAFEKIFANSLSSKIPFVKQLINYILRRKGKQFRPLLVLLSAGALGEINNSSHVAATMIELLHTATLVHDDIVDEAYQRRSSFSINALWKSKVGVLLGDYLLSQGLLIAIDNEEFNALKIISEAVKQISEGELKQIKESKKLEISEDTYFEIIRMKTATLLGSSTKCGAASVTQDPTTLNDFYRIGELIGMSFQIRDDLFAFDTLKNNDKPTDNDFNDKKLTLPIIASLKNADRNDAKQIKRILNRKVNHENDFLNFQELVIKNGGVEYSHQVMKNYVTDAQSIIQKYQSNIYSQSLSALTQYVIDRKK